MQYEGRLYGPSKGVNYLYGMLLALSKSFIILLFGKNKQTKTRDNNVNC